MNLSHALGDGTAALIKEIDDLKRENAALKHQHEAKTQMLYETYCGQLKKMYDVDVRFERGQRIQAQELAAQAAQFPDTTHDLCKSRHRMLERARDDAWERHSQDVNEKRELRESLASLVFENKSFQTEAQEETAKKNKLVEALTQSNERTQALTTRLCTLQSIKYTMRDNGIQVDIPNNADRNDHRAMIQENEIAHSQLLAEKEKTKNLRNELSKAQQCHRESQGQIQRDAKGLEYYKTKLEAQHDVVNKYKDDHDKALEDLATRDRMIVHKNEQLAIMHGDLTKWQKQFDIMNMKLDAREKELKTTDKKPANRPAADVPPKPVAEISTVSESTTRQPVVARTDVPTLFDGMIEAPNEVLALAKHVERLEAAIQGQSREKELKLLRKLVGDKKAHKALETRVAAQQAEMAEQARRLAAKEAEVRRLRDRLEQQPSWGCEKHDVELRRLTQKLNKLKGLSLELTGHIDEGSDALRKCGDAMKEHLRRI